MAWGELSESDKSWIAGIYEGEGSISLNNKYISIVLYNNDLSMLNEVQKLLGGKIYGRGNKRKPEWKPSYVLQIRKKEYVDNFIINILPFFRTDYKIIQFEGYILKAIENGAKYKLTKGGD